MCIRDRIDRRYETSEIFIKLDEELDENWIMLVYLKDNDPNSNIIVEDKTNQGFKIVSPVSGVISSVNRGEKRALISVEIENDKKNTLFELNISGDIGEDLNNVGLWDSLRERPFDRVPNINSKPNYIFVNCCRKDPIDFF